MYVISPQTLSAVAILAAALRIRQLHGLMWRLPLVVISLPMLWLLFKSDVDGLALLAVTLPRGVPLLLLKPQAWACLRCWPIDAIFWWRVGAQSRF